MFGEHGMVHCYHELMVSDDGDKGGVAKQIWRETIVSLGQADEPLSRPLLCQCLQTETRSCPSSVY